MRTAVLQGLCSVFGFGELHEVTALLHIGIESAVAINLRIGNAKCLVSMTTVTSGHFIEQFGLHLLDKTFFILVTQINHLFSKVVYLSSATSAER